MVVEKNNGISLISLIITIIVIIILAAIVIFSGMDTPEKAQLSKVISDIDNVQTAVDQAYYGLYTEKAVAGEVWTPSQFYEAVATGEKNRDNLTGTGLIEISENSLVDINLPKYEGRKWYIAVSDVSDTVKTGSAVLSPGFESQGKTYATLLDIQTGGSDGNGANGGNQSGLTPEESAKLASIEIGDFVDGYMDIDGVSWRVIDKDEATGEVLITTSDAVGNITLSGAKDYIDIATKGENSKLNTYCRENYSANKGETSVRSMTVEDLNKLCRRYPITGENAAMSIENLPLDDLDALAQLYGGEYGRYAYYASNTPYELVVDVTVNGKIYHGRKLSYEGCFFTYDDENGNTYTVTDVDEYKTPIYQAGTGGSEAPEEEKCEPVLVSWDFYGYKMPDEVKEIIGASNSWLASACVGAFSGGVLFDVRYVYGEREGALCYSYNREDGDSRGVNPVVSLSSKLLEEGSADNTWQLK